MSKDNEVLDLLDNLDTSKEGPNHRVLLIDGLNLYLRVFAVNGALNDLGVPVGGVIGFFRSLALTIRETNPTKVVIVYDGAGGSARRRKIEPTYKNNRTPHRITRSDFFKSLDDEKRSMKIQFTRLLTYFDTLPIQVISVDHIEADDTIAYLAKSCYKEEVVIASADQDFFQLIDERVIVWNFNKKKFYTEQTIRDEFGCEPYNYLQYKALMGDKSDNLPGVFGLGPKKIYKVLPLLAESRQIDLWDIAQHVKGKDDTMSVRIRECKEQLDKNEKLMDLNSPLISGNLKARILDLSHLPTNLLSKQDFYTLYYEDKMGEAIKVLDFWLDEHFLKLNQYAKQTYGQT